MIDFVRHSKPDPERQPDPVIFRRTLEAFHLTPNFDSRELLRSVLEQNIPKWTDVHQAISLKHNPRKNSNKRSSKLKPFEGPLRWGNRNKKLIGEDKESTELIPPEVAIEVEAAYYAKLIIEALRNEAEDMIYLSRTEKILAHIERNHAGDPVQTSTSETKENVLPDAEPKATVSFDYAGNFSSEKNPREYAFLQMGYSL
jgi:hypothetical protein